MPEEDDDLARIARQDQGLAAWKELGTSTATYFKELRDSGFSRSEALELTKALVQGMVANRKRET